MGPFLAIVVLFGCLGLLFLALVVTVKNLYYVCQPSEVLVFSGRVHKTAAGEVGYRVIRGGSALRVPLFEKVDRVDLTNMVIEVIVKNAYSKGGIPLTVQGVASIKVPGELPLLRIARVRVHVSADDGLEVACDVLEHRPRDGPGGPARVQAFRIGARVRHDDRVVTLDEHDGQSLELDDAAELAEEAVERLVLLERRREGARDAVHRLELVGPSTQLVA